MENIDELFPGFMMGDFGDLCGLPVSLSLSWVLSVRCQLPIEQGGLDLSVILIDAGNTFDLYAVSSVARKCGEENFSLPSGAKCVKCG